MSIKFNPQAALPALEFVSRAISPHRTLPVLGHIRIKADATGVVFSATDLDVYLSAHCVGEGNGDVLMPGKLLLNAVRQLHIAGKLHEPIVISTDKNWTTLASGDNTLTCEAMSPDEAPTRLFLKGDTRTVDAGELADALRFVQHTQSTDEMRPAICGVLLEWKDEMLHVVASDGRRLSHTAIPTIGYDEQLIVPSKAVTSLVALCDISGVVTITKHDGLALFDYAGCARFSDGDYSMTTKLIEDDYPAWRRVLLKDEDVTERIEIGTDALQRIADWSNLLGGECGVTFDGKTATAKDNDGQQASVRLDTGKIITMLNVDYVRAARDAFGSTLITWKFKGELEPSWFTDGKRHLVVMSMRD